MDTFTILSGQFADTSIHCASPESLEFPSGGKSLSKTPTNLFLDLHEKDLFTINSNSASTELLQINTDTKLISCQTKIENNLKVLHKFISRKRIKKHAERSNLKKARAAIIKIRRAAYEATKVASNQKEEGSQTDLTATNSPNECDLELTARKEEFLKKIFDLLKVDESILLEKQVFQESDSEDKLLDLFKGFSPVRASKERIPVAQMNQAILASNDQVFHEESYFSAHRKDTAMYSVSPVKANSLVTGFSVVPQNVGTNIIQEKPTPQSKMSPDLHLHTIDSDHGVSPEKTSELALAQKHEFNKDANLLLKVANYLSNVEQILQEYQKSEPRSEFKETEEMLLKKLQTIEKLASSNRLITNYFSSDSDSESEYELAQEEIEVSSINSPEQIGLEKRVAQPPKRNLNQLILAESMAQAKQQRVKCPRKQHSFTRIRVPEVNPHNQQQKSFLVKKIIIFKAPHGVNAFNTKEKLHETLKSLNIALSNDKELKPLFQFVGRRGFNNWIIQLPEAPANQLLKARNIKIGKNYYRIDSFSQKRNKKFPESKVKERSYTSYCFSCGESNLYKATNYNVYHKSGPLYCPTSFNQQYSNWASQFHRNNLPRRARLKTTNSIKASQYYSGSSNSRY